MGTIGTSTNTNALGITGSRMVAFSAISGSNLWYAVYYDGTNLRDKTSSDGTTWTDDSTNINGGGSGPNAGSRGTLLASQSVTTGTLHLMWGWDNTSGNALYQQRNSTVWFTTGIGINTSFRPLQGQIYESAGSIYGHGYGQDGKFMYEATNPTSASAFTNIENFTITTNINSSFAEEIQSTNIITFAVDGAATPAMRTFSVAATTSTGPGFPTPTSRLSTSLLGSQFCTATDANGVTHIIYFLTNAGWFEATFDGTTWRSVGKPLTFMNNNDLNPGIMWDGTAFQLFWCKFNATNDYGIGYANSRGDLRWNVQADIVSHNSANRFNLNVPQVANSGQVMLTWMEKTGSPWDIIGLLVTLNTPAAFSNILKPNALRPHPFSPGLAR